MNEMPIPAGELFTITTGVYSDYHVHGVFRALKEINIETLRDEWLANHPEQLKDYFFDEKAFLADVATKGLMETIECWEWHLSDYSRASEMYVLKMDGL